MKKCPNCKREIEPSEKFCRYCGFSADSPDKAETLHSFVAFAVLTGAFLIIGAVGVFVGFLLVNASYETPGIITVLLSAVAVIVAGVLIIVKSIGFIKKHYGAAEQPSAEAENVASPLENSPTVAVTVPETAEETAEPKATLPDADDLPLYDRNRTAETGISFAELTAGADDPEAMYRLTAAWSAKKCVPNGGAVGRTDPLPPVAVQSQADEIIAEAGQDYFLPEELWRRLDRLQDCLFGQKLPTLGNPAIRSIECYTSVYLACGGVAAEGLDAVLSEKLAELLPIAGSETEKLSAVAAAFEEIFDAEAFPATVELLRRRCTAAER